MQWFDPSGVASDSRGYNRVPVNWIPFQSVKYSAATHSPVHLLTPKLLLLIQKMS